jgi:DNA-binding SARP family transcriptional activator
MIDLRLLGAIDVRADQVDGTNAVLTQPKRLALLLYLALAEPAGLHSRDRLLALLWPEATDGSSRHSLRNALHALRRALGGAAIVTRGEAYVGLDFAAFRCDALELRAHLAASRVDQAVALWTGDLALGFHVPGAPDFERWLEEQRAALRRAVRVAAWKRARGLEGAGQAELDAVRRAARLDPGDEPGARWLMRLLAAAGDRSGALQAYQNLADWFAHELDAEPSAETKTLADGLRTAAAPRQTAAETAAPAPESTTLPPPVTPAAPMAGPARWVARATIAAGLVGMVAFGAGSLLARRPVRVSRLDGPAAEAARAVLRLREPYRADTGAYSSYLRGLTLRFQFRFTASRDTFAALVDRAPLYVPGLYGLAQAYIFTALNDLTDPDEAWPKIDALARRALALDSTAASAWLALASEDMFTRLDMARARERIDRARTLDSLEPDVAGMRSVWFRFHGEMDSAVAEARVAHRLDPLSLLFGRLVGKQLFFGRRYEESRQVFAQMLQDDPGWQRGYVDFADLYWAMGRPRDALVWLRRARAAEGDSGGAAALPGVTTDSAAVRLIGADARRTIARLDRSARAGERVPPSHYASAFAKLGDTLATLRWLDSMVVHHDSYLHQIRLDPVFDFLRRDPRYQMWEARSGLPPLAARPQPAGSRQEWAAAAPNPSRRMGVAPTGPPWRP